jgi:hypothetical protein
MNRSFWDSLLRSCTDFKFYKEIFLQPFGRTLRYLLFFSILVTLVIGIRYSFTFNKFVNEGLKWVEENAPKIEIADGIVTASVEQPYTRTYEDYVFIVDTTGQIKEIDKQYKAGLLLTKDRIIIKSDDVRTQEFELKKIKNFVLEHDTFQKWKKFFIFVIVPFMIVVQFFYFIFAKTIQSLIAALIIVVVKPAAKFVNAMNLCIYALSPVTILGLITILASPRPIPFFWAVYMLMYISFIVGGLGQCVSEPEAE